MSQMLAQNVKVGDTIILNNGTYVVDEITHNGYGRERRVLAIVHGNDGIGQRVDSAHVAIGYRDERVFVPSDFA